MKSERNVLSLLSVTTIADFSSVAETTLYTVPTLDNCYLFCSFVEADADVGAALVASIGQNGAETDFIPVINGDNLDADNDFVLGIPIPSATPVTLKKYAAGTLIKFNVSVGGNAVAGQVLLFGILREA